jgi:hypothetical protein
LSAYPYVKPNKTHNKQDQTRQFRNKFKRPLFLRSDITYILLGGSSNSSFWTINLRLKEHKMGKRDDLIAQYADDLKNKCGMSPDMDLLTKVTIGCGPSIYNADASTVAGSQPDEIETVKNNFLIKKLGCSASDDLDGAIAKAIETYGKSERNKYRAVVYYMLTKHFGKESVYG